MLSLARRLMTWLYRRWYWLLGTGIALILLSVGGVYGVLVTSLPPTAGEVTVPYLKDSVSVRFDGLERPFVQARSFFDAVFAEGWLHGCHRLWQMEMFRRAGRGRLAELLGGSLVDADREMWRLGIPQLAERLEANASSRLRQTVEAYVAGVNAAIEQYKVFPVEFLLLNSSVEPWQARDVFAVGALLAFQSGNNYRNELLRMALHDTLDADRFAIFVTSQSERPDFPFVIPRSRLPDNASSPISNPNKFYPGGARILQRLAAIDPLDNVLMPSCALGSNGWVIAPQKSKSGRALFAFDSHDALGLPSLFYEVHLFYGEGRQVRGWSVAGLPGVVNGYNESIAWGFTNIGDTQDLFFEMRSAEDSNVFQDGDEWYTARQEKVTIPVRGRDHNEDFVVTHTRNGPLVQEEPPISLRWTIQDLGVLSLDGFLDVNVARNWQEFNTALDRLPAPSLNATYADIHGTIGFRTAGLLPLRGRGEGVFPLAGNDPDNRWQGTVPVDAMPRVANPPWGYLAAANARVNPAGEGPLIAADNASAYRIQRIQDVLGADVAFNTDDMTSLQVDWRDGQAEQLLPFLLRFLEDVPMPTSGKRVIKELEDWDYKDSDGSGGLSGLVFQQWYIELARTVFAEQLGESLYQQLLKRNYVLNHALDSLILDDGSSVWWEGKKGERIAAAFRSTLEALARKLGPDINHWRLSRLQRVELRHELSDAQPILAYLLSVPPASWGGGPATVGRANYRYDRPFRVQHAATVRVVAELTSTPKVRAVMSGGQSGHPLSGHYSDQFNAWLEGNTYPIASTPLDVDGSAIVLKPKLD